MKTFAPKALFCYKRIDTLKQTIEALQQNQLAAESELYVFSYGPKKVSDKSIKSEIRTYLKGITGFRKVMFIEAKTNQGLATAIISGVTEILNNYGKIIVLEDDLITSKNFLVYMNQGLDHYEGNHKNFSVGGFSMLFAPLWPLLGNRKFWILDKIGNHFQTNFWNFRSKICFQ